MVGDDKKRDIDEEGSDKGGSEQAEGDGLGRVGLFDQIQPPNAAPNRASHELNDEIPRRDPGLAVATLPSQNEPTEQRKEVERFELVFAVRAKTVFGIRKRYPSRHPVDDDVEEAPNGRSDIEAHHPSPIRKHSSEPPCLNQGTK